MKRILVFIFLLATLVPACAQRNWNIAVDNKVRDFANPYLQQYGRMAIDDYIQYAPMAAYLSSGAFEQGRIRFVEHVAVGVTASATMGILVNSLKYGFGRLRPDGTSYNSFPSGHTATAFMGAELVRHEYGWGWGAGAYVVAVAVGALRIYNNRHWLTDVIAGAGIGILSANVGYWMLPLERNWFGIKTRGEKEAGSALVIVPVITPKVGDMSPAFGLSVACVF